MTDKEVGRERVREIEREIHELLQDATMSLIRVGGLLTEAKRNYARDDTSLFLEWAESSFGFKRAYVYRLMGIHQTFGADPALSRVPLNVLAEMKGADEEAIGKARELAARGELDTQAARALAGKEPKRPQQLLQAYQGTRWLETYQPPATPPNADPESAQVIEELRNVIKQLRDILSSKA